MTGRSVHSSKGTGLTKSPGHAAAGKTFPADSDGCTAEGKSTWPWSGACRRSPPLLVDEGLLDNTAAERKAAGGRA